MLMSDSEIKKRYDQAAGKREKKKQVQIMAELNDVAPSVIENILNVSHETPKTVKTQAIKADRLVYEAVLLRAEEVEQNMIALSEEIAELTAKNKAYLTEWGILTEWMKANE